VTDNLFPLVARFDDARIIFMKFERDVQIFEIVSGSEPAEEIRFKRGRGYLALAPDRSIAVYELAPPELRC
jgi:hypothetical protein